jgi:hypothetical protein
MAAKHGPPQHDPNLVPAGSAVPAADQQQVSPTASALKAAKAQVARLEALRDRYRSASAESRQKADEAYRAALAYASTSNADPGQYRIRYDSSRAHRELAEALHMADVQVDGIDLGVALIAFELALIADWQSRSDDLRRESEESRADAVGAAKTAGLSEVTIDFTKHESQRLKDRAIAIEEKIIGLKGAPAVPGVNNPATGLVRLRADVRAARISAEKELYG